MTGAVIVAGLILLVVASFAWARISAARAERRSIDGYGHALGVLGEVARRSENSGDVRIVPRDIPGGVHVRTAGSESEFPAPRAVPVGRSTTEAAPAVAPAANGSVTVRPVPLGTGAPPSPPSPHPEPAPIPERRPSASPVTPHRVVASLPPGTPRISLPMPAQPLRFDDDTLEPAEESEAVTARPAPPKAPRRGAGTRRPRATGRLAGTRRPGATGRGAGTRRPGATGRGAGTRRPGATGPRPQATETDRQSALRRAATGTAAAVALCLAVVGTLQLTGGGHHSAQPPLGQTPKQTGHHASKPTPPASQPGHGGAGLVPSGAGDRLVPTSTTTSDVSFQVPSRHYMLTFSDTGTSDCWVGIETAAGSNVWLWMETLAPGSTTSYQASEPVVVDLGAPRNIDLRVNGITAELPGYALSYHLSFTTGTASA
jgi:hypothetical protein